MATIAHLYVFVKIITNTRLVFRGYWVIGVLGYWVIVEITNILIS